MQLRATLFDMDGLLIDSEVLWHEAEMEIFGSLGITLDADGRSTKGMFVNEVVEYWHEQQSWVTPSVDEVIASLLGRVGDLVEEKGRLLPGALRSLDLASARGPVALASSTPMPLILRCLAHFGLENRFASINSADAEPFGKPHPGVFLTAAAAIGVEPSRCLVFEDSAAGVLAAKAATACVVAVPAAGDRDLATFAVADLVLSSLEDLEPAWLDERFA